MIHINQKSITHAKKHQLFLYYFHRIYYSHYESVLPSCKLGQTKTETHHIERNNCIMPHWFGRFKRKSIVVSKTLEMVDLTIALFARFRVNGDVFDILEGSEIIPSIII